MVASIEELGDVEIVLLGLRLEPGELELSVVVGRVFPEIREVKCFESILSLLSLFEARV